MILTTPFADQIDRVMAYQTTDRPLPAVVVEHPTQNLGPEDTEARARAVADAAERILDGELDHP